MHQREEPNGRALVHSRVPQELAAPERDCIRVPRAVDEAVVQSHAEGSTSAAIVGDEASAHNLDGVVVGEVEGVNADGTPRGHFRIIPFKEALLDSDLIVVGGFRQRHVDGASIDLRKVPLEPAAGDDDAATH